MIFAIILILFGTGTYLLGRDRSNKEIAQYKEYAQKTIFETQVECSKEIADCRRACDEHCKAMRQHYHEIAYESGNAYNIKLKLIREHYERILRKDFNMEKIKVNERKYYIELDNIHLIYEDDELVGWYKPEIETSEARE